MEHFKVFAAVGANGGLAVIDFLANAEPWLHFLLSSGQLAVAVVTVVYISTKIGKYMTDTRRAQAKRCRKCRQKPSALPIG
jgi:hypothetical protein